MMETEWRNLNEMKGFPYVLQASYHTQVLYQVVCGATAGGWNEGPGYG